jgi:choline dehydrogenase-like flavoprotein
MERIRAWLRDPFGVNINTTADYIVVGAGTSGCITAWKLAQLYPHHSVVLVDAGHGYSKDPTQTKMANWFDSWSSHTIIHESESQNFLPSVATRFD